MDIKHMGTEELLVDLGESELDILNCEEALAIGMTTYGRGNSVEDRIRDNRKIIVMITDELDRRGWKDDSKK